MGDGVTISLGDTLPYLETRFLELIGKDQASNDLRSWFTALQQTALIQSSSVKCIGMHRPIPINEIYQPTRLKVKNLNFDKRVSIPFQDRTSRSIAQADALYEHVLSVSEFLR